MPVCCRSVNTASPYASAITYIKWSVNQLGSNKSIPKEALVCSLVQGLGQLFTAELGLSLDGLRQVIVIRKVKGVVFEVGFQQVNKALFLGFLRRETDSASIQPLVAKHTYLLLTQSTRILCQWQDLESTHAIDGLALDAANLLALRDSHHVIT